MTRREDGSLELSKPSRRTVLKTVTTAIIAVLIVYWACVIAFYANNIASTLNARATDPVAMAKNHKESQKDHANKSLMP